MKKVFFSPPYKIIYSVDVAFCRKNGKNHQIIQISKLKKLICSLKHNYGHKIISTDCQKNIYVHRVAIFCAIFCPIGQTQKTTPHNWESFLALILFIIIGNLVTIFTLPNISYTNFSRGVSLGLTLVRLRGLLNFLFNFRKTQNTLHMSSQS